MLNPVLNQIILMIGTRLYNTLKTAVDIKTSTSSMQKFKFTKRQGLINLIC